MGRKRSFASHDEYTKYQKMASKMITHRKSTIGFAVPEPKVRKNKKTFRPKLQWDHMRTRELRGVLLLSDEEKRMVRFPAI